MLSVAGRDIVYALPVTCLGIALSPCARVIVVVIDVGVDVVPGPFAGRTAHADPVHDRVRQFASESECGKAKFAVDVEPVAPV